MVDTYSRSENDKQLSLTTNVFVEFADQHETNTLMPAIKDLNTSGMSPDELLADSLCKAETNCEVGLEE